MSWIKKEMPLILGYESLGDTVEAKRWLDFKLSQLLDTGDPLWEYRSILKSKKNICDFVISQFAYPMVRGLPSDVHRNNWFQNLCCHQVTEDYWQMASETLRTLHLNRREGEKGYGDCEDVAALFVTLFLMKRWKTWGCLGLVYENAQVLGGHGWGLFQDEKGIWRLYEATLSTPPEYPDGYLVADPDANDWHLHGITYQALVKFIRKEYYEWETEEERGGLEKYLHLPLGRKETRAKHEALSRAWGIKTKPLRELGILAKVRWR